MPKLIFNGSITKKAAMFMAGFSLFQCLRIALTASSFALNRFSIPRRNVDIFITKIHNSMEVAIFTGILIMTLYILIIPKRYSRYNYIVSTFTNWLVCLLFFVVLYAYAFNGNEGYLNIYYWGLVLSGFAMGMNQSISMSVNVENISFFAGAIPFAGVQVSLYHILFLNYNKDRPNYDLNYWILVYQIIIAILISMIAAILWTLGFVGEFRRMGRKNSLINENELSDVIIDEKSELSAIRDNIAIHSSVDMGINGNSDIEFEKGDKIKLGKRGLRDLIKRSTQILNRSIINTTRRLSRSLSMTVELSFWKSLCNAASPILMSSVAMGLVYLVFPAIAPYRLTNLVTAHRIDISILITFVAPALINIVLCTFKIGPNCDWSQHTRWHYVWLFAIPYIVCIVLFFIPIHYPDCKISYLMTNSTCVLTFTCFIFALSHAILKTVGFTGAGVQNTTPPNTNTQLVMTTKDLDNFLTKQDNNSENNNNDKKDKKKQKKEIKKEKDKLMNYDNKNEKKEHKTNNRNGQVSSFNILLSYFFLVFFAFLGDGYIKTVKLYERNRDMWPTNEMGLCSSFAYWLSMSFRRGMKSFGQVFTTNIRTQLMA